MTKFTIQSNIPVPRPTQGRPYRYPLMDMKVGESVFLPGKTGGKLRNSVYHFNTKHQGRCQFITRNWEEDGVRGYRVWRVK